jgi:hypothetical protein
MQQEERDFQNRGNQNPTNEIRAVEQKPSYKMRAIQIVSITIFS